MIRRIVTNPQSRLRVAGGCVDGVIEFHRSLPGYAPTPLVAAPSLAAALEVGQVWVKDESNRLGMPSFKILGAAWASYRVLCELLRRPAVPLTPLDQMRDLLRTRSPLCLVAATDGNHGRAVARMARLVGVDAHILVPEDMVQARRDAIVAEGARLTVVRGSYDTAVAESAALADQRNLVVSDTSWPGYERVPAWVIDGYATIGIEAQEQLEAAGCPGPDVVAVQIGVGAFAAAMIRYALGAPEARVIGVEPVGADCAARSIEAGRPMEAHGPHRSIMAGLNCGRVSDIAWPYLRGGLDCVVVVDDDWAKEAMRLMSRAGVISGESGAAGLGGLLAGRDALRLGKSENALLVSTEGATDPAAYEDIVGRRSQVGEAGAGA